MKKEESINKLLDLQAESPNAQCKILCSAKAITRSPRSCANKILAALWLDKLRYLKALTNVKLNAPLNNKAIKISISVKPFNFFIINNISKLKFLN